MVTFDFVFNLSLSFVDMGGGGCMVAVSRPSPKYYRLPICNFVSYDNTCIFNHTTAILDSKMVYIVAFSNYGYVKQIYGDEI